MLQPLNYSSFKCMLVFVTILAATASLCYGCSWLDMEGTRQVQLLPQDLHLDNVKNKAMHLRVCTPDAIGALTHRHCSFSLLVHTPFSACCVLSLGDGRQANSGIASCAVT